MALWLLRLLVRRIPAPINLWVGGGRGGGGGGGNNLFFLCQCFLVLSYYTFYTHFIRVLYMLLLHSAVAICFRCLAF